VGSTIVDGVKIKDMKVGHSLNSLNLASGQVEKKRVLAVIANPLNERLVKIKADGKEFVCTESHEVFTRNGWKRAGDITCEDEVCSQWVRDNAST
jgi:intein/homing endonuclease